MGAVVAVISGLCFGYIFYLFLELIDELSLYQILFKENNAVNNTTMSVSCDWNRTNLLELNQSEFQAYLYFKSDKVTEELLIMFSVYVICVIVSQSLWVVSIPKFVKIFRAKFLRVLLSKEMLWYDSIQPTELAYYLTE